MRQPWSVWWHFGSSCMLSRCFSRLCSRWTLLQFHTWLRFVYPVYSNRCGWSGFCVAPGSNGSVGLHQGLPQIWCWLNSRGQTEAHMQCSLVFLYYEIWTTFAARRHSLALVLTRFKLSNHFGSVNREPLFKIYGLRGHKHTLYFFIYAYISRQPDLPNPFNHASILEEVRIKYWHIPTSSGMRIASMKSRVWHENESYHYP